MEIEQRAAQVLLDVFGYSSFRVEQQQVVEHVVRGGDALVLMSTGVGESLRIGEIREPFGTPCSSVWSTSFSENVCSAFCPFSCTATLRPLSSQRP